MSEEVVKALDDRVHRLEAVWQHGDQKKYYAEARQIYTNIVLIPPNNNAVATAVSLFDELISKTPKIAESRNVELTVTRDVALYLLTSKFDSLPERATNAMRLVRYLGTIRRSMIPGFTYIPVYENVPLPPGVTGMAGMDPDKIKDPTAKKKYEVSIQENQDNNLINERQAMLAGIENRLAPLIVRYVAETVNSGANATLVDQSIELGRLSESERKQISR